MDKSDIPKKKKYRVPRPHLNVAVSHKWTVTVLILSFALSVFFSYITSKAMGALENYIFLALMLLLAIIAVNIFFDIIGTAVQSAEEAPFHSLARRKAKGARESVSIIRHAPQLANLCCDVIGDIAGIISGATTAIIVSVLVTTLGVNSLSLSLILTGIVGALTIGGKAVSKGLAMQNGNAIVYAMGKIIYFLKYVIRRK